MDRVDAVIAQNTSRWNAEVMRLAREEIAAAPRPSRSTVDSRKRKRLPEPPPGWGSDEDASRSSIAAARMLKQR